MGIFDRAKNKAKDAAGKAKETTGKSTNDDSMTFEGKRDQAEASAKDRIEDAKDYLDD